MTVIRKYRSDFARLVGDKVRVVNSPMVLRVIAFRPIRPDSGELFLPIDGNLELVPPYRRDDPDFQAFFSPKDGVLTVSNFWYAVGELSDTIGPCIILQKLRG